MLTDDDIEKLLADIVNKESPVIQISTVKLLSLIGEVVWYRLHDKDNIYTE